MKENKTILVIDDEESMRDSCCQILHKDGYEAEAAEDGCVGLKKAREIRPDLVLIDLKMPGLTGLEVLDEIQDIDPDIIPVVITGYATVDSAVEAMKKGAYDFLPKPFTPDEMRIIIKRGLERRRLIQEAEALRAEKKRMEENFITLVSHQLRSPLVAVAQYLEVILAGLVGRTDKGLKGMLIKSKDRIKELLELINDWLDLAQMNSGKIAEKFIPISIFEVIQKLVNFMKSAAQQSEISLELLPPSGSFSVLGDKESLDQIFSNLIDNAIKYNRPKGSVTISIQEKREHISVEIKDTGIGIKPEHLPFIFDQFYRVKREGSCRNSGSGLGLSIAKKIVQAHGGSIQVSSEPGKGSLFSVLLPRANPKNR